MQQHKSNKSNIKGLYFPHTAEARVAYAHHLADMFMKSGSTTHLTKLYVKHFLLNYDPPCTDEDLEKEMECTFDPACSIDFKTRDMAAKMRDWVQERDGKWKITETYHDLITSVTKKEIANDKSNIRVIHNRMVKDAIIESQGGGWYRKVECDAPDIDIFSKVEGFVDIQLPLGLDSYFECMQKNIIVFAGTQDGGKSCLALNVARLNLDSDMPIRYMSSEMGGPELRYRLKKFDDVHYEDWNKVSWKEVTSGWHDYIYPQGINIIDYVDIDDEFYLVGSAIRKIFDKLDTGIAVICLQKKFGQKLAYGAELTNKLPRLYVSVESNPPEGNIATCVKCKNRKIPDYNLNNRECIFKIVNGTKIIQQTDWHYKGKAKKIAHEYDDPVPF